MFHLAIITPEGQVYNKPVKSVTAPGVLGYFEILTDHAALVSLLKKGIMKITEPQKQTADTYCAVDEGVLEVDAEHNVLVLVDHAVVVPTEREAKEKLNELLTSVV